MLISCSGSVFFLLLCFALLLFDRLFTRMPRSSHVNSVGSFFMFRVSRFHSVRFPCQEKCWNIAVANVFSSCSAVNFESNVLRPEFISVSLFFETVTNAVFFAIWILFLIFSFYFIDIMQLRTHNSFRSRVKPLRINRTFSHPFCYCSACLFPQQITHIIVGTSFFIAVRKVAFVANVLIIFHCSHLFILVTCVYLLKSTQWKYRTILVLFLPFPKRNIHTFVATGRYLIMHTIFII